MSNSVAIVTGASSGIGRATALRLARDFGAIVLAARSGEKLGEVGRQVKTIGAEPLMLELDLMAPTAAEIVVKKTLDRFGRIDALVNIAGAVAGLDVFQMSDEQWNTGMELKFHGARRLTVHAWDALRESKGAVVFISGNAAVIPKAGTAAVGAINAAIDSLRRSRRLEVVSDDESAFHTWALGEFGRGRPTPLGGRRRLAAFGTDRLRAPSEEPLRAAKVRAPGGVAQPG